jgi:hypothetical protein
MSACYVEVLHEMTDAPARSLRELISSVRYHEASGRGEDEPVGSSGA